MNSIWSLEKLNYGMMFVYVTDMQKAPSYEAFLDRLLRTGNRIIYSGFSMEAKNIG